LTSTERSRQSWVDSYVSGFFGDFGPFDNFFFCSFVWVMMNVMMLSATVRKKVMVPERQPEESKIVSISPTR
jgi:hypothetical protein